MDPASLYLTTMNSIGCKSGNDYRQTLLKAFAATNLSWNDARRDSMAAVSTWCRGQVDRKNMNYCREKYQADMNRFLAKALKPALYQNESANFVWRARVSPECNLSSRDRARLRSLDKGTALASRPESAAPVSAPVRREKESVAGLNAPGTSGQRAPAAQKPAPIANSQTTVEPPPIPIQTRPDSDFSANDNFFKRTARAASDLFRSVTPKFMLPSNDRCKYAKYLAEQVQNHTLLQSRPCADKDHNYNQSVLDQIFKIHQKLETMKETYPDSYVAHHAGGGYYFKNGDDAHNGTYNLEVKAGDKVIFAGTPNRPSLCNVASTTLFMGVIQDIDDGRIFKSMTPKQLANFTPHTDGHGAYGALNGDDGVWDLTRFMGPEKIPGTNTSLYSIGKQIGGYQDPKAFEQACAGDFMQWDKPEGGHVGAFLASIEGKAYFWSSNRGTDGYGVTCEDEFKSDGSTRMKPKIVRLTHPENLAAIPEYVGQRNMAGPAHPEVLASMLAAVEANSTQRFAKSSLDQVINGDHAVASAY